MVISLHAQAPKTTTIWTRQLFFTFASMYSTATAPVDPSAVRTYIKQNPHEALGAILSTTDDIDALVEELCAKVYRGCRAGVFCVSLLSHVARRPQSVAMSISMPLVCSGLLWRWKVAGC